MHDDERWRRVGDPGGTMTLGADGGARSVVDQEAFRRVCGHFVTGVTVVTAIDAGEPIGFAVNSFSSVSLDPYLVSFYASHSSDTWARMQHCDSFTVNIMAEGQDSVTERFARKGADRFADVAWTPSARTGSPLISSVHGWIDCELYMVVDVGDHQLVVGAVVDLGVQPHSAPLAFHRGRFARLRPAS